MGKVYFLDDKTREIYTLVNGERVVCCTLRDKTSLPAMEKIRALHEILSEQGPGEWTHK
jgi:hypothetical protein